MKINRIFTQITKWSERIKKPHFNKFKIKKGEHKGKKRKRERRRIKFRKRKKN